VSAYRSPSHRRIPEPHYTKVDAVEPTVLAHFHTEEPEPEYVEIPYDIRDRHIYAIGKTRNGKTTLLYSIIDQDIKNGAGVCVLDPKPSGQKPNLVETILQHIPPEREGDIIYFSAANPVPIDVMSWQTEAERQTLAADLMQTFMQFVAQKDGDRWPGILRFVIHTLLDAKNCTFLDIYNFLIDPPKQPSEFRQSILKRVTRPHLLKFWNETYPLFPQDVAMPILNRMSQHILVEPLNTMLGTLNPVLSIENIIRKKQILLVDLTGAGQETGNFIGTLFVSRIQQAVYRDLRTNFYLFADEFQNFQTSAFDKILSEAGGLGLRLTLANQYLDQMQMSIRSAVRGNVATYFVFQIAPEDTSSFKNIMPLVPDPNGLKPSAPMKPEVLANLAPFTALYAIAGSAPQFKRIPPPPDHPTDEQLERAERIKSRTLRQYGVDACKSAISADNPVSGNSTGATPAAPQDSKPPQKETGRPSVPPVGTQQGNHRNSPRPIRRQDNRPVPPRTAGSS
jgi:hypothetical protein